MLKQKVLALVGVVGLALAALVASAPAADASHDCPRGYTCVYDFANHQRVYADDGNASVRIYMFNGGHVWNNGYRYPGADHITFTVEAFGGRYAICLHYGPWTMSQPNPTVAYIWEDAVVTGWRWRGECAEWEENWHAY